MSYVRLALKWILHGIETGEGVISFVGLITFTLLVFVQVLNRYLLHFEIMWFSDLALYCFIFTIFFTIALTTQKRGNIAVDYFRDKAFGRKPKAGAIHRVAMVITSLAVASIFLPTAYGFMLRALKYPEYGTIVRWFNTSWLQTLPFVVFVLILVHLSVVTLREYHNLRETWRSNSQGRK